MSLSRELSRRWLATKAGYPLIARPLARKAGLLQSPSSSDPSNLLVDLRSLLNSLYGCSLTHSLMTLSAPGSQRSPPAVPVSGFLPVSSISASRAVLRRPPSLIHAAILCGRQPTTGTATITRHSKAVAKETIAPWSSTWGRTRHCVFAAPSRKRSLEGHL